MIDFDLGTEPGTGSPDASAGVPQENFSVRWTGTILPRANGTYTFYVNGDNRVKLYVNSKLVLNKESPGTGEVSKGIELAGNQRAEVKIEYIHAAGDPCLHVTWSGPGFERQILTPIDNASVGPN
jgi:hypothetical protein